MELLHIGEELFLTQVIGVLVQTCKYYGTYYLGEEAEPWAVLPLGLRQALPRQQDLRLERRPGTGSRDCPLCCVHFKTEHGKNSDPIYLTKSSTGSSKIYVWNDVQGQVVGIVHYVVSILILNTAKIRTQYIWRTVVRDQARSTSGTPFRDR